jgi:signal peptidase I
MRTGLAAAGLLVLAGAGLLRRRLAVVTVVGESMRPALVSGDRLLVRRVTGHRVRPGQIIVIGKPDPAGGGALHRAGGGALHRASGGPPRPATRQWMIKRVAAVPGNARPDALLPAPAGPAASPATASPATTRPAAAVVPPGKLVVLGDNLARSHDSRQLGYFAAEDLLGVVVRPLPARRPARVQVAGCLCTDAR